MKKLSLAITIIGLFSLSLASFLLKPIPISSPSELSALLQNQKLLVQGKIIKETYSKNYKTLVLDNNLQLQCPNPCPSFLNKNIEALTILEKYNNKNYLKILRINYK